MGVLSSHLQGNSAAVSARERISALTSVLVASAAIVIGLIWDISWHRSIGRDTFWSPPHVLEQLGALLAATTCGWLVLRMTFGGEPVRAAPGVRVWGFRGPLGAWVCIWGAVMMATSAPFDDWWHNAYGLDVKILSPPHAILGIGMIAIELGALLMALAAQNRATPETKQRLSLIYAIAAGILLTMHGTFLLENAAFPNQMHSAGFYRIVTIGMPLILVATSRPSHLRWPATTTAAIYMMILLSMIWILQIFPATAKLAPIYHPVKQMVPPPFPLLLVVPAVAIDVIMRRVHGEWRRAAAIGVSFTLLMIAAHWWWAEFLLSPAARNAFFAADQWDYNMRPGSWQHDFWFVQPLTSFAYGIAIATVTAIVSSRIGLWIGSGMARVQR